MSRLSDFSKDMPAYRTGWVVASDIWYRGEALVLPLAFDTAIAEYRRLNAFPTGDKLAVSGEVNRMIAATINVNPRWFGVARMRDATLLSSDGDAWDQDRRASVALR